MKHWDLEALAKDSELPADIIFIEGAVAGLCSKLECDGYPRIVRIGCHDKGDDLDAFELMLELAPGVVLATVHGDVGDDGEPDATDGEDYAYEIVRLVEEGLAACMPQLQQLAETVHSTRMRARSIVAGWQRAGLPGRMIDVHLARRDHWHDNRQPAMIVLIEALDELLLPAVVKVPIQAREELDAEMLLQCAHLARRNAARIELANAGASGGISQVAVNAIRHFGAEADTLRRFGAEWRFSLPDGTDLSMVDGHIEAGNGDVDGNVFWMGDRIEVQPLYVPAAKLRNAIGRPLAELLQLPFLTDDIFVAEATCQVADGRPILSVKIDMPRWLFCSKSGRVWRDVQQGSSVEAQAPRRGPTNIVPFAKHRA